MSTSHCHETVQNLKRRGRSIDKLPVGSCFALQVRFTTNCPSLQGSKPFSSNRRGIGPRRHSVDIENSLHRAAVRARTNQTALGSVTQRTDSGRQLKWTCRRRFLRDRVMPGPQLKRKVMDQRQIPDA